MLDSASVNSISSCGWGARESQQSELREAKRREAERKARRRRTMPSPVYQWRKALRRNIEVNCSATRFMTSCMQVELPQKPTDILRPLGGMSQMAHFMLLGIHSTKYDEFLFCVARRDMGGARWGERTSREGEAGVGGGECSRRGCCTHLDVEHLLVDLLGGHAAAEERRAREVAAVARVCDAEAAGWRRSRAVSEWASVAWREGKWGCVRGERTHRRRPSCSVGAVGAGGGM
jgi:hypothetical protein